MSEKRCVFPFARWRGESDPTISDREYDAREAERELHRYRVTRWCRWASEQPNAGVRELGRAILFVADQVGHGLLLQAVEALEGYDWPTTDGAETCDGRLS